MTERVLSLFWSRQTALSVFFFVFVQHSQSPPQKKSGFKRIRIYYFSSFFFLLFLKQGLTVSSRLALNSLCCPGWPQTGNAPTPTSCMPGLQLCAIMSGRVNCFFMGLTLLTDSLTESSVGSIRKCTEGRSHTECHFGTSAKFSQILCLLRMLVIDVCVSEFCTGVSNCCLCVVWIFESEFFCLEKFLSMVESICPMGIEALLLVVIGLFIPFLSFSGPLKAVWIPLLL